MRSFLGRDILSLKDFERAEYFRLVELINAVLHHANSGTVTRHGNLVQEPNYGSTLEAQETAKHAQEHPAQADSDPYRLVRPSRNS